MFRFAPVARCLPPIRQIAGRVRSLNLILIAAILAAVTAGSAQAQQSFSGTVLLPDDKPAADVEVKLEPWAGSTEQPATARTDAEGKFTMLRSPQELFGRTMTAQNAAGDLIGYKFFMFQRTGNETPPSSVELTLAPPASVRVQVTDGSGAPLAGVPVTGIADYAHIIADQTDASGQAVLTVPAAARLRTVFAKQSGAGFDYVMLFEEQRFFQGETFTATLPTEPVQLKLDGARTVTVTLTDSDGKPISGTRIWPWLFNKNGQSAQNRGTQFNAGMTVETFASTTDSSGVATFDWFPTWEKAQEFVFWPMVNGQHEHRIKLDAASGADSTTYQMERPVRIGGIVRKPGGDPAPGVTVAFQYVNSDNNHFGNNTQTGADGRYQFEVTGDAMGMLLVDDQNWAAALKTNVEVKAKTDITDLDFDLLEPTKITGRVTVSSSGRAVPRQSVSLQQSGMDLNGRRPGGSNQYMAPLNHYRQTMTDDDGRFEFKVGPGHYLLRGSQNAGPQQFSVKEEKSLEFNFSVDRPDRGPFTVQIVPGKTGAEVAGAMLEVRSQEQWWSPTQTEANSSGKVEMERSLRRSFVLARTKDGRFADIIEIEPDTSTVTIEVKECGTMTGRLVGVTGQPLKNAQFNYGVVPDLGMTIYAGMSFAGGDGTTDAEGRFTMENVIVNQKYSIEVRVQDYTLQTRSPLSVTVAGKTDVGDVRAEAQAVAQAALPAAVPGTIPEAPKLSWSRMLVIGNLVGIPLLAIGFFIWSRRNT